MFTATNGERITVRMGEMTNGSALTPALWLYGPNGALLDSFGAGGTNKVPPGSRGVAKTDLAPSGVVLVLGEQWTARSGSSTEISSGQDVRVVGQDGLTLIVVADPSPTREGD